MNALRSVAPVHTAPHFGELHARLIDLLRSLNRDSWDRPAVGHWAVRDVAAHLLDGELRRLSIARDGYATPPDRPIRDERDLVEWLNALNEQWVIAARRLSPAALVDLLDLAGRSTAAAVEALDPEGPAPWPVTWAGEDASLNWMDIGREYTERWHHQDQIRTAAGEAPLEEPHLLRPVVDISLRALPHAYRGVSAGEGDAVCVHATGPAGGAWSLVLNEGRWRLYEGAAEKPACLIRLPAQAAARLLLHRFGVAADPAGVQIEGRADLAARFLSARAVMV